MENRDYLATMDVETMMHFISSVFSELNLGLLIYRLEDGDDPGTLKLVYANRGASEYTHTNLSPLVGKYIHDAFPALAGTDLPGLYAEVVRSGRSRNVGAFEYEGDDNVERGYYAVKAFPMPGDCVGIVFENITLRKQIEDKVRKMRERGA